MRSGFFIALCLYPSISVTLDTRLITRQSNCSTASLTASNWDAIGVDAAFNSWWVDTSEPTVGQLATQFGSLSGFQCGIGLVSTYFASNIWPFYVINAVVNLNSLFNRIFTGITNGQLDFIGLAGSVNGDFFPVPPPYLGDQFMIWLGAIIATVTSFGTLGPEGAEISFAAAGAFISAAGQQVAKSLSPKFTPGQGTSLLEALATSTGESARAELENWVNATFNGQTDVNGHTLKDYLSGGLFMQPEYPSNQAIESFYKQQLLARAINIGWRASGEMIFIMAATASANDSHGPNATKYYSEQDQKVYYLYRYVTWRDQNTYEYKGYLDGPTSLDKLNSSTYGINPADISRSSARAWAYAKSNYTNDDVLNRIEASVTSNGALTPFQDGVAWEGVWTIPVCDIGSNVEWNTQFGDQKQGYGRLPCCCGPKCADTAEFVEAVGMKYYYGLIWGCKSQLKGSDINFSKVNYGFHAGWSSLSKGGKAGIIISIIFIFVAFLGGCAGCCSKLCS